MRRAPRKNQEKLKQLTPKRSNEPKVEQQQKQEKQKKQKKQEEQFKSDLEMYKKLKSQNQMYQTLIQHVQERIATEMEINQFFQALIHFRKKRRDILMIQHVAQQHVNLERNRQHQEELRVRRQNGQRINQNQNNDRNHFDQNSLEIIFQNRQIQQDERESEHGSQGQQWISFSNNPNQIIATMLSGLIPLGLFSVRQLFQDQDDSQSSSDSLMHSQQGNALNSLRMRVVDNSNSQAQSSSIYDCSCIDCLNNSLEDLEDSEDSKSSQSHYQNPEKKENNRDNGEKFSKKAQKPQRQSKNEQVNKKENMKRRQKSEGIEKGDYKKKRNPYSQSSQQHIFGRRLLGRGWNQQDQIQTAEKNQQTASDYQSQYQSCSSSQCRHQ